MRTAITTFALAAALTLTANGEYVTAKEGLRLRKSPSLEAEVIEVLPFGTEVSGTVTDGWMQTSDGFLKASFLSEDDPLDQYEYCGTWLLTAYFETGQQTASGLWPEEGTTLAHNTLPFGTQIYVQGYGFWEVQDRGPQSMGTEWADLYLADFDTCVQFGTKNAKVYLVPEKEMP